MPASSGPPQRPATLLALHVPDLLDVLLFLFDEEVEFPDGGAVTVGEELVQRAVEVLFHVPKPVVFVGVGLQKVMQLMMRLRGVGLSWD